MQGRITSKLTFANVVSVVALFVALGGGAYAAFNLPKNSVKSKNIVNGQVKQADISKTLTVAGAQTATDAQHAATADSATNATHATSADSATSATHATSADTATSATSAETATNATKLGGTDASAYARVGSEAWHDATLNDGSGYGFVAPGSFCYWQNLGGGQNPAGYFRDPSGIVHLRGLVVAHDGNSNICVLVDPNSVILTLPPGYQPDHQWAEAAISNDKPGRVNITPPHVLGPGNVVEASTVEIEPNFPTFTDAKQWVSLDGLSFRCAPSGKNGCP